MCARLLLPLSAALLAVGCGSNNYVPVSGKVTLDGKPLANAMVTFQPIAGPGGDAGGVGSFAKTDAQGRYTLEAMTRTPQPGALIGKHRVRIGTVGATAPNDSDAANVGPAPVLKKDIVPERYNTESTLEFQVPSGGTDRADFELSTKAPGKR